MPDRVARRRFADAQPPRWIFPADIRYKADTRSSGGRRDIARIRQSAMLDEFQRYDVGCASRRDVQERRSFRTVSFSSTVASRLGRSRCAPRRYARGKCRRMPGEWRYSDVHEREKRQGRQDGMQLVVVRHIEHADIGVASGHPPQVNPLAGALAVAALVPPGATPQTRIPCSAYSKARQAVMAFTSPLAAA
jgi:hypothetical protein